MLGLKQEDPTCPYGAFGEWMVVFCLLTVERAFVGTGGGFRVHYRLDVLGGGAPADGGEVDAQLVVRLHAANIEKRQCE